MGSLRVEETLAFHPKVLAVGNPAVGLWVRAGAWCVQYDTAGFIPAAVAYTLGTQAQTYALVKAGLWERTADVGFTFLLWDSANVDNDGETLAGPA